MDAARLIAATAASTDASSGDACGARRLATFLSRASSAWASHVWLRCVYIDIQFHGDCGMCKAVNAQRCDDGCTNYAWGVHNYVKVTGTRAFFLSNVAYRSLTAKIRSYRAWTWSSTGLCIFSTNFTSRDFLCGYHIHIDDKYPANVEVVNSHDMWVSCTYTRRICNDCAICEPSRHIHQCNMHGSVRVCE